jgi:DNA-binding NtrC family response regulator
MGVSAAVSRQASPNTVIASPNLDFRRHMVETLRSSHWPVEEALGGAEALARMEGNECQVLLLDRWLPDLDVMELVGIVRERYPGVTVYVVDSASAVPLVSQEPEGRSQYRAAILNLLRGVRRPELTAPPKPGPQLVPQAPPEQPQAQAPKAREEEGKEEPLPDMIGSSSPLQQVYRLVRLVAPRNTTVLITGDTGTGKELVARAIHLVGPRSQQPFVTVNCAAIPEALLESELFGYTRGAFTGAFQSRVGRIHSAHGGTLFLDEVGELPLSMQAKLLRFLQEGEVQRLGSSDVVRVDARVIAATNTDLAERVREKAFREDLYYRLSVFPIDIQPLRARVEDILPLSLHFLSGFCRESGVAEKGISAAARRAIEQHSWPGNVRELRHVIERAFILSENNPELLPEHIRIRAIRRPE